MIVDQICLYEGEVGAHRSGTVGREVLDKIAELVPACQSSVETGCGKSTILLSQLSAHHHCYTLDDRDKPNNSVAFVQNCPLFRQERTRFTFGPTQLTLPRYPISPGLDVALIDGPHGFPFPELEYFYIYPNLKLGALLIVDDLHIPTVGRMFEVLKEDAMFEVAAIVVTTAFLRRTAAPTFNPHWDCWEDQNFNKRRFGSGGSATPRASQVASPSTSATSTPSAMHRAFDIFARLTSRKSY